MHLCVYVDFLKIGMSSRFLKLIFKTLQTLLSNSLKCGFQNGLSNVSGITSSSDMHFKFKKQVMSQKVSLTKFQNGETKSPIPVLSKLSFKYLFYNISWPTWSTQYIEPSKCKSSRVKKVKKELWDPVLWNFHNAPNTLN